MRCATILHAGALGDLILTLHFARRLDQLSRAERVVLVSRIDPGRAAIARWPGLERVSIEGIGSHWLYSDSAEEAPSRLRELIEGATVFSALGGSRAEVSARISRLSPYRALYLDPQAIAGSVRHITEQWRNQVSAQGASVKACRYSSRTAGIGDALLARNSMRTRTSSGVLIHPGSGGVAKCWDAESFVAVCAELGRRGIAVRFVVGPAELERWPAETIRRFADAAELLRLESIDHFADAVFSSVVYMGNDSGPTHLAAWLGTPTMALFGPTDARVWRPLGDRVRWRQGDASIDPMTWGIAPAAIVRALLGEAA